MKLVANFDDFWNNALLHHLQVLGKHNSKQELNIVILKRLYVVPEEGQFNPYWIWEIWQRATAKTKETSKGNQWKD